MTSVVPGHTLEVPQDQILIDGIQHQLLTHPFTEYRRKYRRDMIFLGAYVGFSRGHVAEWEIDDKRLFLLKISGRVAFNKAGMKRDDILGAEVPATLSEIFGPVGDRVPATWFSGTLDIGLGEKRLPATNSGPQFPKYLLISVNNGVCGEEKVVSDDEYARLRSEGPRRLIKR